MDKRELRQKMKKDCMVSGNVTKELTEWKKLQAGDMNEPQSTITVGCTRFFTIFCCAENQ